MKVTIDSWAWLRKDALTVPKIQALRGALTVYPRKVGDHPGDPPGPVYLYTETSTMLGVAREYFVAHNRGGHVIEDRTTTGNESLWHGPFDFVGDLREDQEKAVDAVVGYLRGGGLGGLLQAPPGTGKCLGRGTLVLKYDGSVTPVEHLQVGDVLMGPDSLPRCVLSTTTGSGLLYKIIPRRGAPWVCNDAHILTLVNSRSGEVRDVPLEQYLSWTASAKRPWKQFFPSEGVVFPSAPPLRIDPYFLGFQWGLHVRVGKAKPFDDFGLGILDCSREVVGDAATFPQDYLRASLEDRRSFLAGLLDAAGHQHGVGYEIVQKRPAYAEGTVFLARSLGIAAEIREKRVKGASYWRVTLSDGCAPCTQLPLLFLGVQRIAKKCPQECRQKKAATRSGFAVEAIGEGSFVGFTLDGDGRFLLGDFVVTHNTVMACATMAELQVPTLVVVHKEFLVNQWKERIAQFLPTAKVGIVQQDDCDFGGKSIAIGMMQSLTQKMYSTLFYRWPGLVIFDETHRIGAATFSHVPPKFAARYRLGLTATPRRKDGAESVFFYHIGKVLHASQEQRLRPKVKRVSTGFKLVRSGNFNLSLAPKSLLLKFLCGSTHRNRKISETLVEAVQAGRKVIVLSERLQHLDTLQQMFLTLWQEKGGSEPPSCGSYVGGMSQEALAVAAKAQIIFATSQYAQEGLDLPALDTLFLTTPLADVEQAVGRILRPHPDKKDPIVVDFRDDEVPLCKKFAEMREQLYERVAA